MRRIFIRHTAGPHPGLIELVGMAPVAWPLARTIDCQISPDNRHAQVTLAGVFPNRAYYREGPVVVTAAPSGDPGQETPPTPTLGEHAALAPAGDPGLALS